MIYVITAALHILVCLLIFLGMIFGIIRLQKYMLIVALLLPFWGAIIVLILHFELGFAPDSTVNVTTNKMNFESIIYKSVSVDEKRSDRTVPIEEALLINSAREKRTSISTRVKIVSFFMAVNLLFVLFLFFILRLFGEDEGINRESDQQKSINTADDCNSKMWSRIK